MHRCSRALCARGPDRPARHEDVHRVGVHLRGSAAGRPSCSARSGRRIRPRARSVGGHVRRLATTRPLTTSSTRRASPSAWTRPRVAARADSRCRPQAAGRRAASTPPWADRAGFRREGDLRPDGDRAGPASSSSSPGDLPPTRELERVGVAVGDVRSGRGQCPRTMREVDRSTSPRRT